jgi:hypothetical protein
MALETRFAFYSGYAWDILCKHLRFVGMYSQYRSTLRRVVRDTTPHMDTAMTPVQEAEFQTLEIYSSTRGAKSVVEKLRRRSAARAEAAFVASAEPR